MSVGTKHGAWFWATPPRHALLYGALRACTHNEHERPGMIGCMQAAEDSGLRRTVPHCVLYTYSTAEVWC